MKRVESVKSQRRLVRACRFEHRKEYHDAAHDEQSGKDARHDNRHAFVQRKKEDDQANAEQRERNVHEDWEEVDDFGDAPFLERHVPEVSRPRTLAGITRGKDHVVTDPLLGEHRENRDREAQSVTGVPHPNNPDIRLHGREGGDVGARNVLNGCAVSDSAVDLGHLSDQGGDHQVGIGTKVFEALRAEDGDDHCEQGGLAQGIKHAPYRTPHKVHVRKR